MLDIYGKTKIACSVASQRMKPNIDARTCPEKCMP